MPFYSEAWWRTFWECVSFACFDWYSDGCNLGHLLWWSYKNMQMWHHRDHDNVMFITISERSSLVVRALLLPDLFPFAHSSTAFSVAHYAEWDYPGGDHRCVKRVYFSILLFCGVVENDLMCDWKRVLLHYKTDVGMRNRMCFRHMRNTIVTKLANYYIFLHYFFRLTPQTLLPKICLNVAVNWK